MNNDILLQVAGLRIEARADKVWKPILKDVSFDLRRGEVLSIVGESGAGKSTVGLAMLGYVADGCHITAGRILLDGTDMASAPDTARRAMRGTRISYVAQSAAAAFNPSLRLIDQHIEVLVTRGIASRDEARSQAVALYRRLGLPSPETIGERFPHQLSGGQLQRAMIAMALATKPSLIVFDEPTTALDVTTQIGVMALIREIVAENDLAAIYISHDLAVVAQMASRIMVMRHGEVVEIAPTRQIMTAPEAEYTRSLWSVRNLRKPAAYIAPGQPLLEIDNVSISYGTTRAVDGVSFDLAAGEVVALVGESGSGKTTLARAIAGLKETTGGGITFAGSELADSYRHRSLEDLRAVQLIYQASDTALNPRHTVRRILDGPLRLYTRMDARGCDARARELMEQVNLDPGIYLDRRPGALSGGQMQRVAIARALAANPRLIICDEITSALDQLIAAEIIALLARLQRETGLSCLFVTHDLGVVAALADRVVVMQQGRLEETGPTGQVLGAPAHPYTRRLVASVPQMDPDWLSRTLDQKETVA